MNDASLSKGLKMELLPSKTTCKVGELPDFTVIITNVSFEKILLCTYLLRHRLLISMSSGNIGIYPFGTTPTPPLGNEHFTYLEPGEKLSTPLNIPDEEKYHFLFRGSLPREVPENMALYNFEPGTHPFRVYLGESIFYYVAEERTFAHQRIEKNIVKEVERAADFSVDISTLWDGELYAEALVTFIP